MKAADKAQIRRMIKYWARVLNLGAWEIRVDWDERPEDEDAWASINVHHLYDYANIRFDPDSWSDLDLRTKNRVVVHELLHICTRDYRSGAQSITMTGNVTSDARSVWYDRLSDAEEGMVDRLANCFVELGGLVQ